MKIAVLTDSTAYITKEQRNQLDIHMIPLSVTFGDESYDEETDLTAEDFYNKLATSTELPKTSQPAIGKFVEKFTELSQEYDAVISIHLSSGISGTYQAALSAKSMVEDIDIHVFDSEISAMVQGFFVLEAVRYVNDGFTLEQTLARLTEMKKQTKAYFMVDDLGHLQRGGRLSSAQAIVGSLLQVKPILHFEDLKIVPFEKVRTRKRAINRIMSLLEEDLDQNIVEKVTIIYSGKMEQALELQHLLYNKYPQLEIIISYFGPVLLTHLGPGSIGVGWYTK